MENKYNYVYTNGRSSFAASSPMRKSTNKWVEEIDTR